MTLDEMSFVNIIENESEVKCLFDGHELECYMHHDSRQIVAYLEQSVKEPYHVVTFEVMLEDGIRYFCTEVLALK